MRLLATIISLALLSVTVNFSVAADDDNAIKASMRYAHKAPKGEKKVCEKIVEGTASEEEVKKSLELYKAAITVDPPKGDAAAYREKFTKLIAATEEVLAKKDGAAAAYKTASNCKACHSEHKP